MKKAAKVWRIIWKENKVLQEKGEARFWKKCWRGDNPLLNLRLCASRARSRKWFWWAVTKQKKREEKELGVGACLLAYQAILASSSSSIIILDLTYYYKNYSLSKWKTIDYLPKKIESPTYKKRSQIELNQVTLQRHNDSRVGISPPSEPDVRVSPHPALCRGIPTHCFP